MSNTMIGLKIADVKIAEDKEALLFITDIGEQVFVPVDADCCSHTWIEHVELPALGFPFTIISVDYLDMPDLGDLPGCDVVSYYGAKITTDKGDMVIDYRNDSNGYYGGLIVWPGDDFYGDVFGQNISNNMWCDIVE